MKIFVVGAWRGQSTRWTTVKHVVRGKVRRRRAVEDRERATVRNGERIGLLLSPGTNIVDTVAAANHGLVVLQGPPRKTKTRGNVVVVLIDQGSLRQICRAGRHQEITV